MSEEPHDPEFTKIIFKKLPQNMLKHIMFFDDWITPPAFTTQSAVERRAYGLTIKEQSTVPTRDNYWIWFGAYGVDGKPIWNNKPLVRQLYQTLFGELKYAGGKQKRLVNSFVDHVCDVNVFKYVPSTGIRAKLAITGVHTDEEIEKLTYNHNRTRQIREAVNMLHKFSKTIYDDQIMLKLLEAEGFSENDQKLVLNKFKKERK